MAEYYSALFHIPLFAGTVPAAYSLFAGTVLAYNLFQNNIGFHESQKQNLKFNMF